ncbi:MAG: 50S ribosomal protein L11 methyltransferase [Rhodospirillaceae bacterium]
MTNWPQAVLPFIDAIKDKPDFPRRLVDLALKMAPRLSAQETCQLCLAARRMAPMDQEVWAKSSDLIAAHVPRWHGDLIQDDDRNAAYEDGIRAAIKPGMRVLDIGTGTGLLAMMAARAGAVQVYALEMNPFLAEVARETIAANGFQDQVTVIEACSDQIEIGREIPEPCDALVQEIIADNVVAEDVLRYVQDAKARLLKPNAVLVPDSVSAMGRLIHKDHRWTGEKRGLDLSALSLLRPLTYREFKTKTVLSAATELFRLTLSKPDIPTRFEVNIPVSRSGDVNGVEQWLRLDFGQGIVYENPPLTRSAWARRSRMMLASKSVEIGDVVRVRSEIKGLKISVSF